MTDTCLAVVGDVHGNLPLLDRALDRIAREPHVAGILLVGDLGINALYGSFPRDSDLYRAYAESVAQVLELARSAGPPVRWVPGNHDDPQVEGDGNLDGKQERVGGLRVVGIGGAGPDLFGFPYEWEEEEIRRRPEPEVDVLLCHAPPARTPLDRVIRRNLHVGSEAIRERASRHPGFLVCGHIHESAGVLRLESCLCLNAGALGPPFHRPQVGFLRRQPGGPDEVRHEDLETGEVLRLTLDRE